MNTKNITEPVIKERKTYSAKFDKYYSSKSGVVFLHFVDVKDDKGNLIKSYLDIPASDSEHLIGNILIDQEILFTARMVVHVSEPNGFDLINITFIKNDNKDDEKIGNGH